MKYPILLLFFYLFINCGSAAYAQQSNYVTTIRQLSVEDGLASREVFCGVQDRQGFIWFGTRNGLNRYDGENFLLFNSEHNHMQDDKILNLGTDDSNRLFIEYALPGYSHQPGGKVDIMDLTTHEVKSMSQVFPEMPFKESEVSIIANDGTDDLIFVTCNPYRLWHYSSKKGFTLRLEMKTWQPNAGLPAITWGSFWHGNADIYHFGALTRYYITSDTSYLVSSLSDTLFLGVFNQENKEFLKGIEPISENKIYYGKTQKKDTLRIPRLVKISRNLAKVRTVTYTAADPSAIIKMNDGLYLINSSGETKMLGIEKIKYYNTMTLYQTFLDRQGKYFICTSQGVIELKQEKRYFHTYFTTEQQNIEQDNQAREIYSNDSGKVYANIWDQLFISDGHRIALPKYGNYGYAILNYKKNLYIGSSDLFKYDEGKNELKKLEFTEIRNDIWALFPLSDSTLLMGRSSGIWNYNIPAGKINQVAQDSLEIPNPKFIYRFINADDGKIWGCGENGLFVLNRSGSIIDYYGIKGKNSSHKMPVENFYDIYEDNQHNFWLATNGDGLFRWDRKNNNFKQYTVADGLSSNILYRIEADDYGNLWISSDFGLMRFNLKDFRVHTFTSNDGISNNEFNRISSFKDKAGRLFFGGLDGVNEFDPKDLLKDTVSNDFPLRLISFAKFSAQNDKLLNLTTELLKENRITMEPGDRFFDLDFMLLDFEPGKKGYAYKIGGLDSNWTYINDNSIHISGLPYGDFILQIKGQNSLGAWSNSILRIPLFVVAPFIKKAWFIVLCSMLILLIIYGIIFIRTKSLKKEKVRLEKTISDRTVELQYSLKEQDKMLREKDLLMKEIHHRVKNNLQIISGLLDLQNAGIEDEKAKEAIMEGQGRVRSIALIHQKLYQHENVGTIEPERIYHRTLRADCIGIFKTRANC